MYFTQTNYSQYVKMIDVFIIVGLFNISLEGGGNVTE